MTRSDDFFGEFAAHSRYKLQILETYFEMWGRIMLLREGAGSTVVFVDACAGQGMDDEGNDGSPVIAARAAATAQGQLSEMLKRPIELRVIAIEKHAARFAELQSNLAPFDPTVEALHGTLADHIDAIERRYPGTPTLYFIDPFGLEPLDGSVVRRCLAPERNEALILFADQAALRHFGAAVSQQTKVEKKLADYESTPTLFPELFAEDHKELQMRAARSKAALETTRENAVRILDAAFQGHAWFDILLETPQPNRRAQLVDLYLEFLSDCGAPYRLRIPVLKDDATRAYTLAHASKSPHGYEKMKVAVEYALKHGPLAPEIAELVRWDMRADVVRIAEHLRDHFNGRTIGWSDDNDPSLRRYVLQQTPIMPLDLDELRGLLATYREKSWGRKFGYTFPLRTIDQEATARSTG